MRESKVAKALTKRWGALGILYRRVQWIGRNSAPDFVAMGALERYENRPGSAYTGGGKLTVWVETKPTDDDATGAQAREHKRMRKKGQRVLVINSLELIDRWFPL